jgi:phosphoglycerate dehydrogenase-like enzyme
MLMLMLARRFPVTQATLHQGGYNEPLGRELEGMQLGLVGFGASARELARRAHPFGLRISAIDIRDIGAEEKAEFALEYAGKPSDLDNMIARSDIVSLHLPLTEETRHLLDARRLGMMKRTAFLINVARGALVDEAALTQTLVEGRIGGAGLDVFSQEPPDLRSPLFHLPNVIATTHVSGATDGTSRRRARCAAENIDRVAAGLEPLYRVV